MPHSDSSEQDLDDKSNHPDALKNNSFLPQKIQTINFGVRHIVAVLLVIGIFVGTIPETAMPTVIVSVSSLLSAKNADPNNKN